MSSRTNRDVFVVGMGQSPASGSAETTDLATLVAPAVREALGAANMTPADISAVAWAVSPDLFEGQAAPEDWLARTMFPGIPAFRTNTGGATGADAFASACELVQSGALESVLVVAFQRVGLGATQRILQTIWAPLYEMPMPVNTITQAAFRASRFMGLGRATMDDYAAVSAKNHQCGSRNPKSHMRRAYTVEEVASSRMLAWPVRLLDACPRSQGACAMVVSSNRAGAFARVEGWGRGHDSYWLGDRLGTMDEDVCDLPGLRRAAAHAYARAGISDPAQDLDVIEVYAPFSSVEMMMYSALGLVEKGGESVAVREGRFEFKGAQPVCPSGGCQTSNPIGASGLIRVAEAVLQVSGRALDHQVPNARRALATSTGGASQYFSTVIVGAP